MAAGQGIPSVYPPLENSENLRNKAYVANAVKNGIFGVKVGEGANLLYTIDRCEFK